MLQICGCDSNHERISTESRAIDARVSIDVIQHLYFVSRSIDRMAAQVQYYDRFWLSREESRQDSSGGGRLRQGGSLQHSPNNRAERDLAWRDRASRISRECIAVFVLFGATDCEPNENRAAPACRARNRRDEEGGLIEILIARICRPRAQHPYVNRERRLASSFNDARRSNVEVVATMMLIYMRRESS